METILSFRQLVSWLALLAASVLAGCASHHACYEPSTSAASLRTIYIVKRAWHTGIAVPAADWPDREWSVLHDFPNAKYLEFGWGDARFYQAEDETFWLGVRAALFSTASTIHVIGFEQPTPAALLADEVIEVRVSAEGLQQLARSIEQEFTDPTPVATGASLNATPQPNRFYAARRRFFFPRMCNWWTARRLNDGGCPIAAWSIVTADQVTSEARGFASAP